MTQTSSTANVFKGTASLVLRTLLVHPKKEWTGAVLAEHLDLSQAWVNRVLGTLEAKGYVQRGGRGRGPGVVSSLISPKKLLDLWTQLYSVHDNHFHFYLKSGTNPLGILQKLAKSMSFDYALTGLAAANCLKKLVHDATTTVYLWPRGSHYSNFREMLAELENRHDFLPVKKKANIIILEPKQGNAALFGKMSVKGVSTVSAVQLYLDLCGLDQGRFIIEELADFFSKQGMGYALQA